MFIMYVFINQQNKEVKQHKLKMATLEHNVIKSFVSAKQDIDGVKDELAMALKRLAHLENQVLKVKLTKPAPKPATRTKVVQVVKTVKQKHRAKTFVASKTGKKFHIKECPFAQNIKPKSMIKFKTKDSGLNKGYKPCDCVK